MEHHIAKPYRQLLVRLPFLLLIPVGFLLPRLFAGRTEWVEQVYCARIYPAIRTAISTLTSWFAFSLAEWILYILVLGIPVLLIATGVRAPLRKIPLHRFLSVLLSVCIAFGALLNLFYLTWGINYFRAPLSRRMGLAVEARPVEELEELTALLARHAAILREQVAEDADGVFTADLDASFAGLPKAYAALAEADATFAGTVTRAKRVAWSRGLSELGIAGIFIGLTAEPNVNVDQPPLLLLHGAAHEMAHQLGIASENEAEFVAFLACARSEDIAARYSSVMYALILCGNALYSADADRYWEIRNADYSEGMCRDIADYNAYWKAFEGPAREATTNANDGYLKHNAQPSGIKSYGEAVDLLLSLYAARGESALFV